MGVEVHPLIRSVARYEGTGHSPSKTSNLSTLLLRRDTVRVGFSIRSVSLHSRLRRSFVPFGQMSLRGSSRVLLVSKLREVGFQWVPNLPKLGTPS